MQTFDLNHTNYERVRDHIRADIANGVYAPGHRLKLSELESRYGVSAAPIRDALQQLQGEGFIDFMPNRGASVRVVDRNFLRQVYDIRTAVETFFVRRLARSVDHVRRKELRTLLEKHRRSLSSRDEGIVHDLDRAFHNLIIDADRNVEAAAILKRHYTLIRPLRVRYGRSSTRRTQLPSEHLAILSAVEEGQPETAAALIEAHIDLSFADLARLVNASESTTR